MSVRLTPYKGSRWMVDLRVRLASGEKYRERKVLSARSKTVAKRWAEQREHQLLEHGPTPEAKEVPTLEEFAPRFLNEYAKAERQKPSGIKQKEIALRVHLLPLLGKKRLDCISNEDVQRLKRAMQAKSPKTVNNVLTVLSKLLKVAVDWNVIERLPCSIKLLKVGEGSLTFWGFDEYDRLIDAAGRIAPNALLAVLLGGDAGLRAGEIRALEWTDLDFVKRQIRVERSEWQGHVTSTKGNRVRYVPMTERLSRALQQHRHLKGKRVLCEADGTPLKANALAYLVERATRSAGLASGRKPKDAGPHVLRHTFCSHLAMRGAPAPAIQRLAGHRDLMTTQRYVHLTPAAIESAIRLLELPVPAGVRGNSGAMDHAASAKC